LIFSTSWKISKITHKDDEKDYFSCFSDAINEAKDFAIGPFLVYPQ
jgi:hypothetical protein